MKKTISVVGGVIAFAVAFALSFNGVKGLFGGSIESQIEKMARDLNKQLPKQIDEATRLDRVDAGPGKSFAYNYTITINVALSDADKRKLQDNVTREVLSKAEMKPIFDAGVTVWYKYHDAKGAKVLEFSVQR